MTKEIFDILPPEKIKEQTLELPPKIQKKKNRGGKFFFFAFLLLLISGLIVFVNTFFYSSLIIYLTPRTETKIFKIEFVTQTSQIILDLEKKILPGFLFEIEKEGEKHFKATGKDFVEGKSQGIIRVYNSYNPPTSLNLVPNTRFLSAEKGKIFRSLKSINLEPAKIEKGKIIPSFKDIEVLAQESGEEYNIGPSKFSIPGLSGTSFYYTTWGESFIEMKGGFKKEVRIITEEDIKKAKKALKKELGILIKKSLKEQLSRDFVLAQKGFFLKTLRISCNKKPNDQGREFLCQTKIKGATIAFKLSDLKKLVFDFLKFNLDYSKEYNPQKLVLEYFSQNLNLEKERMILNLKIKVPFYEKIPKDKLISELKGKSEKEIKRILKNYSQIKEIKLKFYPFWPKKAPSSEERIKIEIQ